MKYALNLFYDINCISYNARQQNTNEVYETVHMSLLKCLRNEVNKRNRKIAESTS